MTYTFVLSHVSEKLGDFVILYITSRSEYFNLQGKPRGQIMVEITVPSRRDKLKIVVEGQITVSVTSSWLPWQKQLSHTHTHIFTRGRDATGLWNFRITRLDAIYVSLSKNNKIALNDV
jgi:hypothetical protein